MLEEEHQIEVKAEATGEPTLRYIQAELLSLKQLLKQGDNL